ncbi:GntR family transcriptional regulator [Streptomyces sp. NPDC058783]|uniref:GntR family transcriptional regulator n=1 Tax=Streptomyces sp. NPDC058783 TaxID=3346633 RepID=UPI003697DA99
MARTDEPGYVRIARELRDRITAGADGYRPGDQLPTLPDLSAAYSVSEPTVRQALRTLREEGLIETRARAGTRVRERPPIHRLQADRYRRTNGPPATPYTRDQGIGWSEYRLDKRFERVEATPELAALFEVEPGEALLARHFVFYSNDVPTQMSTSYVRWGDVAGTPVADPIHEPWPGGTRAQLESLGHRIVRVTESLTGGMPTPGEVEALRLGGGVPVMRFTRRHIADGGRVVEVAHPIVRRADTTVVEYVVDLDD